MVWLLQGMADVLVYNVKTMIYQPQSFYPFKNVTEARDEILDQLLKKRK